MMGAKDVKKSWIKTGSIATTCGSFEPTIIQWGNFWVKLHNYGLIGLVPQARGPLKYKTPSDSNDC